MADRHFTAPEALYFMPEPSPAETTYSRNKVILIIFSLAMGGFGIGTGE